MLQSAKNMFLRSFLLSHVHDEVSVAGRASARTEFSNLRTWRPASERKARRSVSARTFAASDAEADAQELHQQTPIGRHWEEVKKWVVFSDLHVSPKTIKVCCEILRRVRAEAEALDAGVIFLGDFWHARGQLPVEPLNLVIHELRQWTQPTLMLVGNHDQVDLGGMTHALTPLAAACENVHVFDRPTVALDALWLPYRKSRPELELALASSDGLKAVFGHADVRGALVNEIHQAREGLEPSAFPQGLPVFLGHYHKPHRVRDSNIRYVGSPYQVSRSEAGQLKELLILDSTWKQIGSLPLDVGPRHFNAAGETLDALKGLRSGDRVRWALPEGMEGSKAELLALPLRADGIDIEIVPAPAAAAPRIEEAEDLGPLALFQLFAETVRMSPEAIEKGANILKAVAGAEGQSLQPDSVHLCFDRLEVEGYGPFKELAKYGLGSKGLRVVSGRNEDDSGADSNGAGKSALLMAALWCLTGRSDSRSMTAHARGLTAGELVNDDCKRGRAKIEGTANGRPFSVERIVASGKRGLVSLRFTYDGDDLTLAESKMTQEAMDRLLGCQLLTRVVFHSQTDVAGLLEADDKDFKYELSRVIDLDAWEAAKEEAAEQLKAVRSAESTQLTKLQAGTQKLDNYTSRLAAAKQEAEKWEEQRQLELGQASAAVDRTAAELAASLSRLQAGAEILRELLADDSATAPPQPEIQIEAAEEPDSFPAEDIRVLNEPDEELAGELQERLLEIQASCAAQMHVAATAAGALQSHKERQAEFLKLGAGQQGLTPVCDRCLQPIDGPQFEANLREMQSKIQEAAAKQQAAQAAAHRSEEEGRGLGKQLQAVQQRMAEVQRAVQFKDMQKRAAENARLQDQERRRAELERAWQEAANQRMRAEQMDRKALQLMERHSQLLGSLQIGIPEFPADSTEFPDGLQAMTDLLVGMLSKAESAGNQVTASQLSVTQLSTTSNPHVGTRTTLEELVAEETVALEDARRQVERWRQEAESLKEVDAAFSRTGVQSFALEGVLGELQTRTAAFLEQLSSGTTLELSASRPATGTKGKAAAAAVERITKTVRVRTGTAADSFRERSVRQLSGGERRRVALALTLGFADLISARSRLRCNLLVLDEVLQQLDEEGCSRMAHLLKQLSQPNVLIVGQADSYVMKVFDKADIVVKRNGCSFVEEA